MKKSLINLLKTEISHKAFLELPQEPGIYIFWRKNIPIYIGKAINLKNRLRSYLNINLEPKTQKMIHFAQKVSFIKVTSELESLLLESYLIKKYQPKFNILSKDDKHPLYIKITKEQFPRIVTCRKIEKGDDFFGPFTQSRSVYSFLRFLRKVFPYSDHKISSRPCFYSQVKLCNPCPNVISKIKDKNEYLFQRNIYLKNIGYWRKILTGNIPVVKKSLIKEMELLVNEERFEEAINIRDKISLINYITQPITQASDYVKSPNLIEDIMEKQLSSLNDILYIKHKSLKRIECFDIAHLSGTYPTASMVTFINGIPDKSYYRKFKILQNKGASDTDSMKEVIKRRLKYIEEWGKPDLIIVDGGKAQVGIFYDNIEPYGIPIIGIAKRFETLVIPYKVNGVINFRMIKPKGNALHLVQRIRNEAHRFAQAYHHQLVKRSLFNLS